MKTNTVEKQNIIDINKDSVKNKNLSTTKRTLSDEDKKTSEALYDLWLDYKAKNRGICQKTFAQEQFGWSQGLFSQYLTGKVPVSLKNALKFAKVFDCDPGDIRSEFRNDRVFEINSKMESHLSDVLKLLSEVYCVDLESDPLCVDISNTLRSKANTVKLRTR